MQTPTKPGFAEALRFWFKLGWISFGGPAGQIAIMHTYLVEQKRWLSEQKFMHALNYCMLLPGPEAQQLATYTGWLLHGTKGGLAAGILFVAPSALILLILSILYVSFGEVAWVYSLFNGLKPAVVAIIILALIKIGKRSMTDALHWVIAGLSFLCMYWFAVPFPLIITVVILFGFAYTYIRPENVAATSAKTQARSEEGFYLTTQTILPHTGFSLMRLLKQVGVFMLFWVAPFLLCFTTSFQDFWINLITFFSQAAFITFGGAYAVLPYVAQQSVDHFQWLTDAQMIDGLALGETTPGPLIMVLAFVGFMGGYHVAGNSILMGTLGLFATTYYTFLPCFLFIFAGAPIIEKTQQNTRIKHVLGWVTAAVTGVVLNLTVYFAETVVLKSGKIDANTLTLSGINWLMLGWIVISVIAMHRFKVGMITWIGISALFGLITWLV